MTGAMFRKRSPKSVLCFYGGCQYSPTDSWSTTLVYISKKSRKYPMIKNGNKSKSKVLIFYDVKKLYNPKCNSS